VRRVRRPGFCLTEARYHPRSRIPRHAPETASLCLALEGGYREQGAGAEVTCEPATLMFHPPGYPHADVIGEAGGRCLTVALEDLLLTSLPDEAQQALEAGPARRVTPRWQVFGVRAALLAVDDRLDDEVEELLLGLLADVAGARGIAIPQAPPPWLGRVRERIHDEYACPLDLRALAHTGGVHPMHLARAFRAHFRCTIGEYVRQRRVEFACRALLASEESLSGVAYAAGFTDQSHFTTTFRRWVGMTPGRFRDQFAG